MNQHEPTLPAIKAPEGYRPVFADMDGLTATEYRMRQMEAFSGPNRKPTPAEIVATYRELGSWSAAGEALNMTPYYVKKIVRGR